MDGILVGGAGGVKVNLLARYGNRHGLVAGATGTGKTVSLLVLAEGFSRLGVPVFMADVKGDVSGLAVPGTPGTGILERAASIGIEGYAPGANPVVFWDLLGRSGHRVRTTVSEMGPTLLARILELNDTQTGVLEIVFRLADDQGLLLLDLEDLAALLSFVADSRREVSEEYGLVSAPSVAAIRRALLRLDGEGGGEFFGEPALDLADLMQTAPDGRGVIGILAADRLVLKPRLYSSFLLWLLSELFENLPEVGDQDRPRLVFIFDEAHLLFDDAPGSLLRKVEQVVRIIRSKGVGVYFCSQFPDDVPGDILGQLGNRIQHALRAYTPRDRKAVRTAAETFVPNPAVDVEQTISTLGVGEALVSMLADRGAPMPVERVLICPPRCRMGALDDGEREAVLRGSPLGPKYGRQVDRESAAEILARRKDGGGERGRRGSEEGRRGRGRLGELLWGTPRRQGMVETFAKQTARTVGSQLGRQIFRGLLGGILGRG
jgi:hypothetical protein